MASGVLNVCGFCGLAEHELVQPPADLLAVFPSTVPLCTRCEQAGRPWLKGRRQRNAKAKAAKAAKKTARAAKRAPPAQCPGKRRRCQPSDEEETADDLSDEEASEVPSEEEGSG